MPADPLWTAKQDSISLPAQIGLPGLRHSIGLARWWHLGVDALWLLNGLIFYVLLFASGHWRHLVPTSWAVFPNALSVLIQYLSLDWPLDNGWVAYNSLQLLAYFAIVFVAAPLALVTGLGMSPALSTRFKRISRPFSIQTARSLHFLVLVWFLVFIVTHTAMVFTTGLLVNLNHIYPGRNDHGWLGLWLFLASMVVVVAGWAAATPFTLRHPRAVQRAGQAIVGPLQHLFEHLDPKPGQYSEADISPYFWHNGQYPDSDEYKALFDGRLRRLPAAHQRPHRQSRRARPRAAAGATPSRTDHPALLHPGLVRDREMGRVSMQTIVDLVKPQPEAKWVVFYSLGEGADKGVYYDAHPIEHMSHHLTMLAYDMNDQPLSFGHGAPLRLRNENELGFKQVKWIKGIEFVAHYSELGSGHGGYNQDHEFFGYRQSMKQRESDKSSPHTTSSRSLRPANDVEEGDGRSRVRCARRQNPRPLLRLNGIATTLWGGVRGLCAVPRAGLSEKKVC